MTLGEYGQLLDELLAIARCLETMEATAAGRGWLDEPARVAARARDGTLLNAIKGLEAEGIKVSSAAKRFRERAKKS